MFSNFNCSYSVSVESMTTIQPASAAPLKTIIYTTWHHPTDYDIDVNPVRGSPFLVKNLSIFCGHRTSLTYMG
jgi:hypothetical protein